MTPPDENKRTWLTLLPLAALLAACATNSPPIATVCPEFPPLPAVTVPPSSPTFSETARQVMQGWQNRLTESQAISGQ